MTTPTPPVDPRHRPKRSLTSRTSLLTAAAIAGVLVAGAAAVAANIGILNAADSSTIGELTATDGLLPATDTDAGTPSTTGEAPRTPSTTVTAPADDTTQQYDITDTGTVWVTSTSSGLALDHVVSEPGWSAVLTHSDERSLAVEFSNGDRTIVFTASLADDGTVAVVVTEPTIVLAHTPAPALTPSTATQFDDDHEDDDHEDHEDDDHEDDDHEDHEDDDHEDHEDDDHEEYEGADDDD